MALREHLIAALQRRAAARDGAQRALLQARIAALQAQAPSADAAAPAEVAAPAGGALAALAELLGQQRPVLALAPARGAAASAAEPELLQYVRSTWARLDTERRLRHALAAAPENPGPLNSHHLVHQALQLMRETAPDYLRHFIAQVDVLMWLERQQAEAAPAARDAGRGAARTGAKGTAKGRPRAAAKKPARKAG